LVHGNKYRTPKNKLDVAISERIIVIAGVDGKAITSSENMVRKRAWIFDKSFAA
jgi:hypothetical protein